MPHPAPTLTGLRAGDRVRIVFRPVTDSAWIAPDDDGTPVFADAAGFVLPPCVLAHIVRGTPCPLRVASARSGAVALLPDGSDEPVSLTPAHVTTIEHLPLARTADV